MKSITKDILHDLERYNLKNKYKSEEVVNKFKKLITNNNDFCLNRKCFEDGHITTSAVLFNVKSNKILLTYHSFLKLWLPLGGHFENDKSILDSAIREAKEESGIDAVSVLKEDILNLGIHLIPENKKKNEQAHYHYDIIFLLRTEDFDFKITDESIDLKWFDIEEVREIKYQNTKYMSDILNKVLLELGLCK